MPVYEKWATRKYGAFTVGKDASGYDVKFFGATTANYVMWDASANALLLYGAFAPGTTDQAALGTSALMFSDLFLASGAVINFNNGNVTITHAAGALACTGALTISIATATTSATTGALIVTGGIGTSEALWVGTTSRLVGAVTASSTLGIAGKITSTSTTSISFNPTLVPDETRTNYIWSYGTRATAKDLAMAASASYNLDPVQMNLNIIGTAPTSSTVNLSYMKIAHAFADMTALRLKCADWNISIAKNILDAYVYQGEIDITATSTISGEVVVLGLVANASAGTITGVVRGATIAMTGASMPATSSGLFIYAGTGATLTHALYIATQGATTITNAIYIETGGTLTNVLKFGETSAAVVSKSNSSGAQSYTIRCAVGGVTGYLRLFAD